MPEIPDAAALKIAELSQTIDPALTPAFQRDAVAVDERLPVVGEGAAHRAIAWRQYFSPPDGVYWEPPRSYY